MARALRGLPETYHPSLRPASAAPGGWDRGGGETTRPAHRGGAPPSCGGCPRQDSNLRTRLRRPMLYPLSYGG